MLGPGHAGAARRATHTTSLAAAAAFAGQQLILHNDLSTKLFFSTHIVTTPSSKAGFARATATRACGPANRCPLACQLAKLSMLSKVWAVAAGSCQADATLSMAIRCRGFAKSFKTGVHASHISY